MTAANTSSFRESRLLDYFYDRDYILPSANDYRKAQECVCTKLTETFGSSESKSRMSSAASIAKVRPEQLELLHKTPEGTQSCTQASTVIRSRLDNSCVSGSNRFKFFQSPRAQKELLPLKVQTLTFDPDQSTSNGFSKMDRSHVTRTRDSPTSSSSGYSSSKQETGFFSLRERQRPALLARKATALDHKARSVSAPSLGLDSMTPYELQQLRNSNKRKANLKTSPTLAHRTPPSSAVASANARNHLVNASASYQDLLKSRLRMTSGRRGQPLSTRPPGNYLHLQTQNYLSDVEEKLKRLRLRHEKAMQKLEQQRKVLTTLTDTEPRPLSSWALPSTFRTHQLPTSSTSTPSAIELRNQLVSRRMKKHNCENMVNNRRCLCLNHHHTQQLMYEPGNLARNIREWEREHAQRRNVLGGGKTSFSYNDLLNAAHGEPQTEDINLEQMYGNMKQQAISERFNNTDTTLQYSESPVYSSYIDIHPIQNGVHEHDDSHELLSYYKQQEQQRQYQEQTESSKEAETSCFSSTIVAGAALDMQQDSCSIFDINNYNNMPDVKQEKASPTDEETTTIYADESLPVEPSLQQIPLEKLPSPESYAEAQTESTEFENDSLVLNQSNEELDLQRMAAEFADSLMLAASDQGTTNEEADGENIEAANHEFSGTVEGHSPCNELEAEENGKDAMEVPHYQNGRPATLKSDSSHEAVISATLNRELSEIEPEESDVFELEESIVSNQATIIETSEQNENANLAMASAEVEGREDDISSTWSAAPDDLSASVSKLNTRQLSNIYEESFDESTKSPKRSEEKPNAQEPPKSPAATKTPLVDLNAQLKRAPPSGRRPNASRTNRPAAKTSTPMGSQPSVVSNFLKSVFDEAIEEVSVEGAKKSISAIIRAEISIPLIEFAEMVSQHLAKHSTVVTPEAAFDSWNEEQKQQEFIDDNAEDEHIVDSGSPQQEMQSSQDATIEKGRLVEVQQFLDVDLVCSATGIVSNVFDEIMLSEETDQLLKKVWSRVYRDLSH